jgi:hypothetical protein
VRLPYSALPSANKPDDALVAAYTSTAWPNASCAFSCLQADYYRSANSCVLAGVGEYVVAGSDVLRNCSAPAYLGVLGAFVGRGNGSDACASHLRGQALSADASPRYDISVLGNWTLDAWLAPECPLSNASIVGVYVELCMCALAASRGCLRTARVAGLSR